MSIHALPDDDDQPNPGAGPITLVVDGEVFTLRMRPDGGCDYAWESGPNDNYGFGSGPVRTVGDPTATYFKTLDEHRSSISDFLADVNPETGYLD